ncbi:MAG: hypothetical protein ABFE01_18205, partial [Phycisphaerales bacterium]
PDIDFARLTITQLEQGTGITRQSILAWTKESGLPRNIDNTYSLAAFVRWYAKWERDKATGGAESAGLNPLQAEKARREKRENDEAEGRLVPYRLHQECLNVRARSLRALLNPSRAKEWAQGWAGKAADEVEAELLAAFARVLAAYRALSPDVPMNDDARARIEEGLAILVEDE